MKRGLYDFTADYRNIAYFNAVPRSPIRCAPRIQSSELSIRSAAHRPGRSAPLPRQAHHAVPGLRTQLGLRPRNRDLGAGRQSTNSPCPILLRDSTNNYRGGVRFEFNRFHVTLEQGGTTYKDDDQASFNGVPTTATAPRRFWAALSLLNALTQAYGIRGSSMYTRVLVTASPFSWMNLYGQFLYSESKTDARYFDIATGNFALLSSLLLYSGQYNLGTSAASAPHTPATRAWNSGPSGGCGSSNRSPPTGTARRASARSPNRSCCTPGTQPARRCSRR